MSEPAPRDVSSLSVDGQTTQFLSPTEQAQEDRRQAERQALKRTKRVSNFFRMFRISTGDRP